MQIKCFFSQSWGGAQASCMLGRCSTTWATPPQPMCVCCEQRINSWCLLWWEIKSKNIVMVSFVLWYLWLQNINILDSFVCKCCCMLDQPYSQTVGPKRTWVGGSTVLITVYAEGFVQALYWGTSLSRFPAPGPLHGLRRQLGWGGHILGTAAASNKELSPSICSSVSNTWKTTWSGWNKCTLIKRKGFCLWK